MTDRWQRHATGDAVTSTGDALRRAEQWAKQAEQATYADQQQGCAAVSVAWATIAGVLVEVDR